MSGDTQRPRHKGIQEANGNMTEGPRPSWSGAPGMEDERMHMEYDAWNRLVAVYADNGSGAAGHPLGEYEYDGLHRRIEASVESDATPDGTLDPSRDFYYSTAWQVIEERVDGRTNPTERIFVWGARYIDDLRFYGIRHCSCPDTVPAPGRLLVARLTLWTGA